MMRVVAALLALVLAAAAAPAFAVSCSVSAQNVSFGGYNPIAAGNTDAVGDVGVTCGLVAVLLPYSVSLSTGTFGTYAARKMANGSNRINYNLYTDVTRLLVWGDGVSGDGTVKVSGTFIITLPSLTVHYTVYGRIPGSQNVAVGAYSDTITVTLEF